MLYCAQLAVHGPHNFYLDALFSPEVVCLSPFGHRTTCSTYEVYHCAQEEQQQLGRAHSRSKTSSVLSLPIMHARGELTKQTACRRPYAAKGTL